MPGLVYVNVWGPLERAGLSVWVYAFWLTSILSWERLMGSVHSQGVIAVLFIVERSFLIFPLHFGILIISNFWIIRFKFQDELYFFIMNFSIICCF